MRDPIADRFVRTHLKTRHLVLLVELGRHGSILRAADAAHMTQPAASKLLAELEYALGVQLFERLARGISPTWYGDIMIRRAGTALAEITRYVPPLPVYQCAYKVTNLLGVGVQLVGRDKMPAMPESLRSKSNRGK